MPRLLHPASVARIEALTPSVHLNGSARTDLLGQFHAGYMAVQEAIDALPYPNARDYYVRGDGAYSAAKAAYDTLQGQLFEVQEVLRAITEKLSDHSS